MSKARYSSAQIAQFVADFNRDGFLILPGFIDSSILTSWAKAFEPLLLEHLENQADPSFRGANRHYITLPFTAPFADPRVFEDEDMLAIVEGVAGKEFVMCQLASDTPTLGSDYQDLHADTPPLFPETSLQTPSYQLAYNFPLCDVTRENGPLEITRGTHIMNKAEALAKIAAGEIKIEAIEMKLGDVILRDVRGIHRGTPNKTSSPRPMVVIGYSRKWLHRPEVSIQIPRAEWDKLSPRAQHMLRHNPIVEKLTKQRESYKAFAY